MPSDIILLTPRAKLFRSLSHDIRVLMNFPITTKKERSKWYDQTKKLREKFHSKYKDIYDDFPHELEHYLDDADIRAIDEGYRIKQQAFIGEFLQVIATEIQKGRIQET